MRILVTGGAGFIGSHLVDRLLLEGHAVTTVDSFDPFYDAAQKQRNIGPHQAYGSFDLRRVDIRDRAQLFGLAGEYGAIVHLAARAGVRPSIDSPEGYLETNVTGTQHLLEFARDRGIGTFIFGSSSSVYGINPNVPWREEDHVLQPISPYASTKVSGELLGHVYSHLFGIRFLALRFFTVYGPRQRPDLAFHKFARLMLAGRPIQMYGDGGTRRDYTYVGDIVDGIVQALKYEVSNYEIVNLGNNHTVSLREMVGALERALGVSAAIEHLPDQPGDVPQTWADISKARRLLGYSPSTTLDVGLAEFAGWMKGNGGDA